MPGIEAAGEMSPSAGTRPEALAGSKDVGVFGGDIARQVLEMGRLDEIIVRIIAPVLLGDGVPLFGMQPGSRVSLERVHLGSSGALSDLRYRVVTSTGNAGPSLPDLAFLDQLDLAPGDLNK